MKVNNQLKLQRLIGKVDNDFNISESDWIPRVAAWVIDALSQMKVLPMERKRRELEVSDKIAQFPCELNATELKVFDSNGNEIPVYNREKECGCRQSTLSSTGELIGITDSSAKNGWETVQVANIVNPSGRNFVLNGNCIELNFDTDKIEVESYEVATYHDDYYDCECPYIYDDGLLLEALSWYILFKYLSRGSHHAVYDLKSNNPVTNPYIQWNTLRPKAAASVKSKIGNAKDGWNNFFYNWTFLPRG
ncbi:MAG: hypothetical protein IJG68_01900 [Bacilli bacterium]|nr:hypothetical protein [Bacilli bacterium]